MNRRADVKGFFNVLGADRNFEIGRFLGTVFRVDDVEVRTVLALFTVFFAFSRALGYELNHDHFRCSLLRARETVGYHGRNPVFVRYAARRVLDRLDVLQHDR